MYGNGSQFDGAAAFSGGGFMPSQTAQPADSSFSSAKNRDVQALLPLTVKQISDALMPGNEKSEFIIDGVDVNNVKLVGIVREKVGRVTDVTFVLDDGTARIHCNKWFHEAIDSTEMDSIEEGMYVCIHGRLKSFQDKKTFNMFAIRPVEDYNEIAAHFIECIYVHFYNNKIRKQQGGVNTQPQPQSQAPSSMNHSFAQYSVGGSNSLDDIVLNFLQQPEWLLKEEGATLDIISLQLKIPQDKLRSVMDNLIIEGTVYSTIDDFHYKATSNA